MMHFALIGFLLAAATGTAFAQTPPAAPAADRETSKFSGVVFGDYYAFAESHLEAWDGQHGFWIRRVYATYDHTFTPRLSARARLELNGNGELEGGPITIRLKDAYLKWQYAGRQAAFVGLHPTPLIEFVQDVWGMRHIEKSPLSLYRWDSSRDTGVSFSGPLNPSGSLHYALQYGNESGTNSEADSFKAYRAAVRFEANPGFSLQAAYGHFNQARDADRRVAQVFGAYRAARGRAGLLLASERRRGGSGTGADTGTQRLVSGFGVVDVVPEKTTAFLRVDRHADPCASCRGIDYLPVDSAVPFTFTVAGIDQAIHKSVRISPNVEWVQYDRRTDPSRAARDVVVRLTFYWVF